MTDVTIDVTIDVEGSESKSDAMVDDYVRVAESIRFLEENYLNQPSLDEVAARLHLCPAHF